MTHLHAFREKGADGLPRFSRCFMYDNDIELDRSGNDTRSLGVSPCKHGWEYDTTDYDRTIPTDYNWVCERAEYSTHIFSLGALGAAVGQVVFGILADK